MKVTNRLPKGEELYRVQHIFIPLHDTNAGITDDELASVLHECVNLETAQLSGIPDTSNRTIRIIAAAANNLQGIDLSGCSHVTEAGILELAAQCTTLAWIRLNGVLGITDPAISALAKSCPRLEELELKSCNLLTALCIRDIWTFTRRLRHLKLAKCTQLTDKAFPSRASPNSSYSINSPSLKSKNWIDTLPPLTLPPSYSHGNLRVLDLGSCSRLTDEAVAGIVTCAPKIQTLILSGCVELTNDAVDSVCKLGIHLDVLALANVQKITDPAVVRLVRSCSRLKSVDLAFCDKLTDMSVLELAGLPCLLRLNLVNVRHTTDNAIFFLAEHAASMERLHLSHCPGISLDAIHLLTRKLELLQHLTATGVPSLFRPGIERFSEKPPLNYNGNSYRVFIGRNIKALCNFLDKEKDRQREAESKNIIFVPRSDDRLDLY